MNIMNSETECPMWFTTLPARLTKQEAAKALGFSKREVELLTSNGQADAAAGQVLLH